MKRDEELAARFEAARPRLRRIAQRILGNAAECDDALQEVWLRLSRADVDGVANLEGWLTTVVARICLDSLRRRESRREELIADDPRAGEATIALGERPEEEAMLADAVGLALLVLLDALQPAERVAFVLHDMFDVPFDDIATIVDRTPEATRQLASRARRRVRGVATDRDPGKRRHDELVRAFFAASRAGNFSALLELLDPGVTLRPDAAVVAMGAAAYWGSERADGSVDGADAVARAFSGRARAAQSALIDGEPGAVWMHEREVRVAFRFTIHDDRIAAIDLVGDRDALENYAIELDV